MLNKRILISQKDNVKKMKFNLRVNTQSVVLRESTPVDEFYTEEVVTNSGEIAHRVVDPIYMVFNQERIKHMGDTAIAAWIDSLSKQKNSSMSKLKAQCSDADLLRTVKSRYLQTPSELRKWADYCANNLDEFNDQVQQAIQAQQSETTEVESQTTE